MTAATTAAVATAAAAAMAVANRLLRSCRSDNHNIVVVTDVSKLPFLDSCFLTISNNRTVSKSNGISSATITIVTAAATTATAAVAATTASRFVQRSWWSDYNDFLLLSIIVQILRNIVISFAFSPSPSHFTNDAR